MSERCAYEGCGKPIAQHRLEKGARFCSTKCRGADHRERGKTIPAVINSCGRARDGSVYVVARVPADFYAKCESLHPGELMHLLPRSEGEP